MNTHPLSILMISNNYTPYRGGVVSALQLLCAELKNSGHQVNLITLDFGAEEVDAPHVIRVPSLATFKYHNNWMAIPWRPRAFIEQQIAECKPDIIHLHHPFLLGVDALSVARRYYIPTVFTYHTRYADYAHYVPVVNQSIARSFIQKAVDDFCNTVDHIIVPTSALKSELAAGVHTGMSVIPSAIDESFFSPLVRVAPRSPLRLVTVGRLVPEKNIPFLLRVMTLLHEADYQLTIIGDGFLRGQLEQYATQQLGLNTGQVKFHGHASKAELVDLYQQADLFIFASQTETQGLVLAEAMASGLPIVALQSDAACAALADEQGGLLISSEDEMAQAIAQLSTDAVRYRLFSTSAMCRAQEYRASAWIEKITGVYRQLLEKNSA